MLASSTPGFRFKQLRESAGIPHDEAAQGMGISTECVWDIETYENELIDCYSPIQVVQFCRVMGTTPRELFAIQTAEPPLTATDLVSLVYQRCQSKGINLEQFEDMVGWTLSGCMEPPERLLQNITIEGLQWLCEELEIDWQRVMLGL